MSYQPKGKTFTYNGEKYILGIAESGAGDKVVAVFTNVGNGWEALLPLIKYDVRDADIMAHGSVAEYIKSLLPIATQILRNPYLPAKPLPTDKIGCVVYDLALDVFFNPVTLEFELNKEPPLSHAR